MSRDEAVDGGRGDRPGCCAMCPITWCPCVFASHRGPGDVETDKPEPIGSVPMREHELRRAA